MKLMKRKSIVIRVPYDLSERYETQADKEGYGTLSGWIVSVLNEKSKEANKVLTKSQQEVQS